MGLGDRAAPGMRWAAAGQPVGSLPAWLRERLAATAEQVASAFELGARVRARLAARSGPDADYYRSRAAWNRAVADFERRQARALRAGRLLATPWRPAAGDARGQRPAGQP